VNDLRAGLNPGLRKTSGPAFVELFRPLIPAFAASFYTKPISNDVGITTVDFDTLKHFYADSYETLSEILPLAIAYNNLSERSDFKAMKAARKMSQL
jgi:hypothetical protein